MVSSTVKPTRISLRNGKNFGPRVTELRTSSSDPTRTSELIHHCPDVPQALERTSMFPSGSRRVALGSLRERFRNPISRRNFPQERNERSPFSRRRGKRIQYSSQTSET